MGPHIAIYKSAAGLIMVRVSRPPGERLEKKVLVLKNDDMSS